MKCSLIGDLERQTSGASNLNAVWDERTEKGFLEHMHICRENMYSR